MPTNILRDAAKSRSVRRRPVVGAANGQLVELQASGRVLRAVLLVSATADRLWAALPIRSTASLWGDCVTIDAHLETGRERAARLIAQTGEIYFEPATDRLLVCFGTTPISRPGEVRLPGPCNPVARALGDPGILRGLSPGSRVDIVAVPSRPEQAG